MNALDGATWQALGLVLTLCGLLVSAIVWVRSGPARGLRAVAWSLLPLAAGLTGVLRLGWEVGDAVVRWAARLVFSPVVWLGLVVAAVSAVLFAVSGILLRRGAGRQSGPTATAPLPSTRSRPAASGNPGAAGVGDLDDIEEILRKHGIQ